MRLKVYFLIFLGFLLAAGVSSAGKLIGDRLKVSATKEIVDIVNTELKMELESDPLVVGSSGRVPDSFKAANRDISNKYSWYFIISLAVQTVLIASIIIVLGNLIIATVKRSVLL